MEKLLTPTTLGLLASVALLAYLVTRRGFFATTVLSRARRRDQSR